jgi:glucosyl-3-phosphoglycerate synthase
VGTSDLPQFAHRDFSPAALAEARGDTTVSVCLPARNEAATVGPIVATIGRELVERHHVVDEIVVVDDHSTDATADLAERAGARVVDAADLLPEYGEGHGKGEALWKSVFVSRGDVIAWCDSDIRDFDVHFITGLLGPLLTRDDLAFVKGHYERPLVDGGPGGGRVTELVARPLLSLLFPHLAEIVQPLSGEYGGRRTLLERLPFVRGYGVDIGLLIDVAATVGTRALAQVDLGTRLHRNRTLDQLSPQAMAVMQTALVRAGRQGLGDQAALVRPGHEPTPVDVGERPAPRTVPGYDAAGPG